MNVRLFGFDIEITMGFWLTAVLITMMSGGLNPIAIVLWALVLLISILVHELGHAFAFRAFGIRSSIRLHFLGGATFPAAVLPMTRPQHVIVSLAGPFAGFALAGAMWVVKENVQIAHPGMFTLVNILFIANLWWSIINLAPVLPLDGGHVVEHTLGPKRYRWTLGISAFAGALIALWCVMNGHFIGLFIFGSAAVQAAIAFRETGAAVRASRVEGEVARSTAEPIDPVAKKILVEARAALDDDDPRRALELAGSVLDGKALPGGRPQARVVPEALTVIGWAHLALGDTQQAAETVARLTRTAHGDPALVAAVALAKGEPDAARRLLEAARAAGDERKEVFGPLIHILLQQNEHARAAALALDCAEGISSDDLKTVAKLVSEAGVHNWAGRLHEAVFKRDGDADDAFEAARAFARAADTSRAIDLMKRAVHAGFSDTSRAWADEALVGIDELEHVLPRPS